ncbi:hypothetical protein RSAG8_01790, partial [Rhizoctonia solani AG-8 WAC10335]
MATWGKLFSTVDPPATARRFACKPKYASPPANKIDRCPSVTGQVGCLSDSQTDHGLVNSP